MADSRDGIFDTGTFDNARFDSVYATSNASIFSVSGVKALLKPSSFLSAYSNNSKVLSLRRSVSSYGNVFSSMDRVIALDRFAERRCSSRPMLNIITRSSTWLKKHELSMARSIYGLTALGSRQFRL